MTTMQRYSILHRTYYNFTAPVQLGPHTLLLRPREGPELRIESSTLTTTPPATLRWHRDVEDNAVATASFEQPSAQLAIESDVVVQQYNVAPLDFVMADYAANYPFSYSAEDDLLLSPYRTVVTGAGSGRASLEACVGGLWRPGERVQTYTLLQRLASNIQQTVVYRAREEAGVQSVEETLSLESGSCRDSAFLFIEAARSLGLAARFVSGYLCTPPSTLDFGATHAWAEVFLPGAGWKGFDPTLGQLVGADHIAVAVARLPESVPPVAGTFTGPPGARLAVGVWLKPLP